MMSNAPEYIKRVNAALALREVPDYPAALAQLQIALKQAPNDVSVHLLLGLTHQDMENWEDAAACFRQILELDSQSQEARQGLGISLIHLEEDAEAVDLLIPINNLEPGNLPVAQALAQGLTNLEKVEDAIDILQNARVHQPGDASLALQLVELFENQDQVKEALAVVQETNAQCPAADLLVKQGDLYLEQHHYDEAINACKKAIEMDRTLGIAWVNLARAHMGKGELGDALAIIDEGSAENPADPFIVQIKAVILSMQNKESESLALYEKTIAQLREQNRVETLGTFFLWHVWAIRRYRGDKKALAQLEKYYRDEAADTDLLDPIRVNLLLSLGRYDQVISMLRGIEAPDAGASFYRDYFLALYGAGQPAEAFEYLRENLTRNAIDKEEIVDRLHSVAFDYYTKGQCKAAQDFLEFILEISPDDSRALNNLGFILTGEQQWEQALHLLQLAQQGGYIDLDILDANRAYIYTCQKKYSDAIKILDRLLPEIEPDKTAILRVPYPMPDRLFVINHPGRLVYIRIVVAANLSAAYYLAGQPEEAVSAAQRAIEANSKDCIPHAMLGCLEFCNGSKELAVKAWKKALRSEKSEQEKAMIKQWLNSVEMGETTTGTS